MIITDIDDTDLYKISMQQAAWHQYPKARGRYELAIRTRNPAFPVADIFPSIRDEILGMETLSLTNGQYSYIEREMPWIKHDYLDWLATFRFQPGREVKMAAQKNGSISVEPQGEWHRTILYEVPALSITEELYCNKANPMTPEEQTKVAIERLIPKVEMLKKHPRLCFTDFGTRRRFSKHVQRTVVKYLKENCPNLIGTSNVGLAREFGLKAIGTVAHEWMMAHLALVDNLDQAQIRALHVWQQEYDDNLGTALTDTFTTKAFWKDFGNTLSSGYSGVRQDSGDPLAFGWDAIAHYKKMGIDPRTKSIIFSDSLDFPKMIELFETFIGLIGVGFGIGTNLTNDMGIEPLSIVMKLMELNGVPLVKLSDASGKIMGDPVMVDRVRRAYGVTA